MVVNVNVDKGENSFTKENLWFQIQTATYFGTKLVEWETMQTRQDGISRTLSISLFWVDKRFTRATYRMGEEQPNIKSGECVGE